MRTRTLTLPRFSARRPAALSLTRTVALPRLVRALKRRVPIGDGLVLAAARPPAAGRRSTPTSPSQNSVAPGRHVTGRSTLEVEEVETDEPDTSGAVAPAGRGSGVRVNHTIALAPGV